MTVANMTTLAYFVKAKQIQITGNNGSQYDRVLLYLTYDRNAPQFLVETSTKRYDELKQQDLQPGDFLFAMGEFTFLPVKGHEYEEHISKAQKEVCYHIPVLKNTRIVKQPSRSTPVSSVTYVGQLMFDPTGNDRNDKPFFQYTKSGLPVLNFSPIVRGGYKDAPTSWMQTVVFSKKAEFIVNHFKKMDLIAIDGYLDLESYEGKILDKEAMTEKAATKYKWIIKANNARFCSAGKREEKTSSSEPVPSVVSNTETTKNDWDTLPF